ncbi:MAG: RNA polymerase sigma factor [Gemmatimonadota bacterium]
MTEDEVRAGPDAGWFEEEVMELLPDLLSAACYMAERRADAEDVVAEAVARAWEHREDLRDRDRFRGWIFRILRNCHLGRCRSRDRRPEEVPLPGEGDDEPSFSLFERLHQPFLLWWGDPEEQFFDRLLQEDLERAVEELPEVYRSVLVLADVQGLSYAEISDALDVPVGTVRSRLSRARSRLQESLWQHAVDAGLREPRNGSGPADGTAGPEASTSNP